MPLEEDAQAFLRSLEYSLGEEDEPIEPMLAALSLMLRQVAEVAERSVGQPRRVFDAARYAYGFEAADALASLTGIARPPLEERCARTDEDVLYKALGEVCTAYGGHVGAWRQAMGFLFRDLWEAAHGREDQRHIELLLHQTLGIEAAFSWYRVCRMAKLPR
ncbi:hypothetical protein [Ideonella sp. B508-1]|uniref:hypothetical protein n=1 Tax=Ideonella sp. B508-1 TaxID=137716 RepID=UPI0003B446C3|nr:hypothetical protein [Ideonella sp. B508-1]